MLFADYKFRDIQKRDLDESQKISYLITAFNLHSDHRMRACSSDLSLKLRVGDVLSYERAVINLTHTENEIYGHELSAALANTTSNQYSLQNDLLATTLQHDNHINMIQSSKKRSKNFDRTSLCQRQHERIRNEDPNPSPRMNRYGYDGPNRHNLVGIKFLYQMDIFTLSPNRPTDHVTRSLTSSLSSACPLLTLQPQPKQQHLLSPKFPPKQHH